tara:strand:+ start:6193 stop:6429 length:237 start_codon:yes stop_codon:yes gene_type:complete
MGNCLFYAIVKFIKNGGYIIFRKSKYGNWSHIMWTPDFETFYHFVPVNQPLRFAFIHKIFFKGRVKVEKRDSFESPNC